MKSDKMPRKSEPKNQYVVDIVNEKPGITEGTKKNYICSCSRALRLTKCDDIKIFVKEITKYEPKLRKALDNEIRPLNMIMGHISAILNQIYPGEKYNLIKDKFVEVRTKVQESFDDIKNDLTPRQESKKDITFEDINNKLFSLRLDDPLFLTLAVFILLPVQRVEEYSRMWIKRSGDEVMPEQDNDITGYIDLLAKRPHIVYIKFKNSRAVGRVTRYFDSNNKILLEVIYKSLLLNQRDYLFTDINNEPFKTATTFDTSLNRKFAKIFDGVRITNHDLRNKYANHNVDGNAMIELSDRSKDLNHSLKTHMDHYIKK